MGTFSVSELRKHSATLSSVADKIEDLAVYYNSDNDGSLTSTTSTSFTTLESVSATVESDQVLVAVAVASVSGSSGARGTLAIAFDSSQEEPSGIVDFDSTRTSGTDEQICILATQIDGSGAVTVDLDWKVTTGTIYCATRYLHVFAFRRVS